MIKLCGWPHHLILFVFGYTQRIASINFYKSLIIYLPLFLELILKSIWMILLQGVSNRERNIHIIGTVNQHESVSPLHQNISILFLVSSISSNFSFLNKIILYLLITILHIEIIYQYSLGSTKSELLIPENKRYSLKNIKEYALNFAWKMKSSAVK